MLAPPAKRLAALPRPPNSSQSGLRKQFGVSKASFWKRVVVLLSYWTLQIIELPYSTIYAHKIVWSRGTRIRLWNTTAFETLPILSHLIYVPLFRKFTAMLPPQKIVKQKSTWKIATHANIRNKSSHTKSMRLFDTFSIRKKEKPLTVFEFWLFGWEPNILTNHTIADSPRVCSGRNS